MFKCKIYKKEPRIRISICDQLIDEFILEENNEQLSNTEPHVLAPVSNTDLIKSFEEAPLRFYELDLSDFSDKLNLKIYVDNNDSNYCNGFLSKSTQIQLRECSFFPLNKRLLEKFYEIHKKRFSSKNYAWYQNSKSQIFSIRTHFEWRGDNAQILQVEDFYIGGSGYFECKLVKKYKIFIPKLLNSYRGHIAKRKVNYFYNKYTAHADQGNFN